MRSRGTVVGWVVAAALAASAGPPAGAGSADIRTLPFLFRATEIPNSSFAEPSIALSPKDHLFICGPLGFPGGGMGFVRSEDWRRFTRRDIVDRTGGGDCHVAVGADGAVYTANLQVWASAVRRSVDDGRTFSDPATEDPVEQDRQWLATDPADPNVVYLGYHEWGAGAIIVAKSTDGARTFVQHALASSDLLIAADTYRSTFPGPLRVDPTDHERVYMVWSTTSVAECERDPAACPAGRAHHRIVVGRSEDGGLTWTNHVAMSAPPGSQLDSLIPWIAVDRAGNVYVVAAGHLPDAGGVQRNGVFLAASADHGQTWTGPVKVNQGDGAAVFPTVAAGAQGVVDVTWIESTAPTPDEEGVWRVHFAQARDGLSAVPTFVELTGPVVHRGAVCTRGVFCTVLGGDRRLLDFMDMALDRFGYAHVVVGSTEDQGNVLYWRQEAGPSASSEPCSQAGGPDCVTVRPGPLP